MEVPSVDRSKTLTQTNLQRIEARAQKDTPLRDCISRDKNEIAVYGVDVLAQPLWRSTYLERDPLIHTRCSRALPMAREEDIVVLSGKLDDEYYSWLRSFEMGPKQVVAFGLEEAQPLADLILLSPGELMRAIERSGKKPVYVPFYSGEAEAKVAEKIGASLFGCEESIALKYFNKESFKSECNRLGLPTVDGIVHRVPAKPERKGTRPEQTELATLVSSLLHYYPSVLIRETLGSGGRSVYRVENPTMKETIQNIQKQPGSEYLIEPFFRVIASPNDQWAIMRNGEIFHIGVSAQVFKGLKHVGNIRGQYFSKRVYDHLKTCSSKMVESMAEHGYRGILGIDYIVADEGIFPIENNARMNGSSFAFGALDVLKARHGQIHCWKFFKAVTEPCTFEQLKTKLAPLLYNGSGINCVFPYDCDTLPNNGVFVPLLVAEDMYHIQYLEEALEEFGVRKV